MVPLNRWHASYGGGGLWVGEMNVQSMGKDFCPNLLRPLPKTIDRRKRNDGSRELISVFHNPHRKG